MSIYEVTEGPYSFAQILVIGLFNIAVVAAVFFAIGYIWSPYP